MVRIKDNPENLVTKINYKTTDEIWKLIVLYSIIKDISRNQAIDELVIKGYKSFKDEEDKERGLL